MQPLDPLAIMHIAFGAPLDLLHLLRVDEEDLEAARLQELKKGDPIDAGRFEGHGSDATRQQPVGKGVQVSGIGAEAAHRLGIITGRDRHEMGFGPDVDARRMQIDGCQLRWEGGLGGGRLVLGHGGLHNASGRSEAAGAGAARLKHSSKRDQGDPVTSGVAAGSRDQPNIRAQGTNALSVSTSRYHSYRG